MLKLNIVEESLKNCSILFFVFIKINLDKLFIFNFVRFVIFNMCLKKVNKKIFFHLFEKIERERRGERRLMTKKAKDE